MNKHINSRADAVRVRLAQEAARIIIDDGVWDFRLAKRKAADRLRINGHSRNYPTNIEIEAAVAEYQRLFRADSQPHALKQLRQAACEAMRLFVCFNPRLVGPVLKGTAPAHADVSLHLFADSPEQVAIFLLEHDIPFETTDRRLKWGSGAMRIYPVYRFVAGDACIKATIFAVDEIREAPLSVVDGRPMRRAALHEVEELVG
jgi:hypothetical protein